MIPGGGQAYNGQSGKAGLMLLGEVVSVGVLLVGVNQFKDDDSYGVFYAGLVGMFGFWVWSWIDAPITAKAINRRIDAGQVALEIGPQLFAPNGDSRVGLSLVRMRF